MNEKTRTVILLILLAIAIGFIIWMNGNLENNFTESL